MLGVFSSKDKLPVILEVIGGSLPTFTQSLIGGKGISSSSSIPKVESVAAVLHQNKIQAETFVIHVSDTCQYLLLKCRCNSRS